MKTLLALLLATYCGLGNASATSSTDLDFDRSNFGNAGLPIWSELNDFESWATGQFGAARSGDADALLALYLLAAGERLSLKDYQRYRTEMDQWIAGLPLSGDPLNASIDARRLYVAMHSRYLGTELASNQMPELYRENQSQLTEIFRSGKFNCISSALLYVVAARKLGLDVDGVILPSHAFVQLTFPDGIVEIETTSFSGFDVVHDEAFYASDSDEWFSERSLKPPSFADYQSRDIISPYELGLFNMINQHTTDERMSYLSRMRLAELRAQQRPWDEPAQKSRLAYYYQEFVHLRETGDYATSRRMFEQIDPYLVSLEGQRREDPELTVLLTAVQAQMADTLVRTGEQEEGLALARHLLQTRDFPEQAITVRGHLFAIISGYAVDRAESGDYPGGRYAFNALEFECLQDKICNSGLAQVYSAWAMHYVEDNDWERSADIYREYLLLDSTSKLAEYFTTNLQRVYLNWAASEEWQGEWETALALLNQCTQLLEAANECESALSKLDAKRKDGYL